MRFNPIRLPFNVDNHLLHKLPNDLLTVCIGRRQGIPDSRQVAGQLPNAFLLFRRKRGGQLVLMPVIFLDDLAMITKPAFPRSLQGPSN